MFKNKIVTTIITVLLTFNLTNFCIAQIKIEHKKADEHIYDTYQLFLDFKIQSIQKIEYEKENKRLEGYLDEDKSSIVLDNYDGKSRVKVTCKDIFGETHEIIKSRCFIDPYEAL